MAAQQCACTCSPPVPRAAQEFMYASPAITFADRWDHFLARWGVNRMGHVVQPGLYKLGLAIPESPVFASANYTLSFDALRSALAGIDAYILVLDTRGINIWCAAGKGTFGTDELVRRIDATGLSGIVSHRRIILPQLGRRAFLRMKYHAGPASRSSTARSGPGICLPTSPRTRQQGRCVPSGLPLPTGSSLLPWNWCISSCQ